MPTAITFNARLKEMRQAKGLTLRDLALLADIDPGVLSRLERGQRRDVRLTTAVRLADALHCTLDHLACRTMRRG